MFVYGQVYNEDVASSLVGFAVPRKIRLATIFDSLYVILELYDSL